jgi:general stress protein CsbA
MNAFHIVVLILLTIAGYSFGAVTAGKRKIIVPKLLDIVLMVVLLGAALITRKMLNQWLVKIMWVVISFVFGLLVTLLRLKNVADVEGFTVSENIHPLKRFWKGWKRFGKRMANYQSRVFITLFYFVFFGPFSVIMRTFNNPMKSPAPDALSLWIPRENPEQDLPSLRNQF